MKYSYYNPNPHKKRVGDCTVRAISKLLNQDWDTTFLGLCLQGFIMADMPSANSVWGEYLRKKGFRRREVPDICPDCFSMPEFVNEFAANHPRGNYLLALFGHVVCLKDGVIYDTWDSGEEPALYYWERTD